MYDPIFSSEYQELQGTYGERSYGSLHTTGYEAIDTVCFTPDQKNCVQQFRWFAVTYQDGGMFSFQDGILGLVPYYNDYVKGPLFIWELFENGSIEEPSFAFYLTGD